MLMQITHPAVDVVATKASGTLTAADYEQVLIPALDAALERSPKIAWYYEMVDFTGWKPRALWDDLSYGVKHAKDFRKIAIVGDKKWEEWMASVMDPFTSGEVKFFPLQEKNIAWDWVGRP